MNTYGKLVIRYTACQLMMVATLHANVSCQPQDFTYALHISLLASLRHAAPLLR